MEFVLTPWLRLSGVIFQAADGSGSVTSLLNVSLVSLVDVVVEGIFEWEGVGFVGALDLDGDGSNDGFVWSPWVGDESGGVEESGSDDVGLEIFLNSAFFHGPSDNFNGSFRFVFDLDLVETVVGPVVALIDVSWVEVVVDVVVMTEVVGWVEVCGSH